MPSFPTYNQPVNPDDETMGIYNKLIERAQNLARDMGRPQAPQQASRAQSQPVAPLTVPSRPTAPTPLPASPAASTANPLATGLLSGVAQPPTQPAPTAPPNQIRIVYPPAAVAEQQQQMVGQAQSQPAPIAGAQTQPLSPLAQALLRQQLKPPGPTMP